MSKYTVVVADALRARFFSLQDSLNPEIESTPRLVEKECLVNSEKTKPNATPAGSPASGRTRASSSSGASYAFDDHRAKREADELRRFAGQVVKAALKQTKQEDAHSLVLVAGKKTLGLIRDSLGAIRTNGLVIRELDRDLTADSPERIQELLARQELIPPMRKPVKQVRVRKAGLKPAGKL